jgi:hypothetical protein
MIWLLSELPDGVVTTPEVHEHTVPGGGILSRFKAGLAGR